MSDAHAFRLYSWARLKSLGTEDGFESCFSAGYSTQADGSVYLHDRLSVWSVGRGSALHKPCDVPIRQGRVSTSALHATIYREKDTSGAERPFLKNVSHSSSAWVNGVELAAQTAVALENGAEIWLGPIGGDTSAGFTFTDLYATRPFLKQYAFETMLGSGGYGEVYKVHERLDPTQKLAVKALDFGRPLSKLSRYTAQKELAVVQELLHHAHPHIADLVAIFDDADESGMYLYVMEYFPMGDLHNLLVAQGAPLGLDMVRSVTKQICLGIQFLHGKNIIHRDIKFLNVLVRSDSPWHVALGDFGLSRKVNGSGMQRAQTILGTPAFAAPEVYLSTGYDKPADVYASGVVLFVLIGGDLDRSPYTLTTRPETDAEYAKLRKLNWNQLSWRNLEPGSHIIELVKSMLCLDPGKRWTMSQVLRSAWLSGAPTVSNKDLRVGRTRPMASGPSSLPGSLLEELLATENGVDGRDVLVQGDTLLSDFGRITIRSSTPSQPAPSPARSEPIAATPSRTISDDAQAPIPSSGLPSESVGHAPRRSPRNKVGKEGEPKILIAHVRGAEEKEAGEKAGGRDAGKGRKNKA